VGLNAPAWDENREHVRTEAPEASRTRKAPTSGAFPSAPEKTRTSTDQSVHKALNQVRVVWMVSAASRTSKSCGLLDAMEGMDVVTSVVTLAADSAGAPGAERSLSGVLTTRRTGAVDQRLARTLVVCPCRALPGHRFDRERQQRRGAGAERLRGPCDEDRRLAPALAVDLAALGQEHAARRAALVPDYVRPRGSHGTCSAH
jgi:hypothetical protein